MWGWIKKWFDPITTSKIFILSDKDVYPTLSAFIEPESIPKKYGGGLDFECGKLPLLDPPVRAALDLRGSEELFLTAPVRWMDDENGEMMALGVGSVDGHERKERMATLHSLALETLTRSSTHQGQHAPSHPDTAQTQSQASQPAILASMDRHSTPPSSRPESRHHVQQAPSLPDVTPTYGRPSQSLVSSAVDQNSTSSHYQPDSQHQSQQAPLVPNTAETQTESQPPQLAISSVTDQKPTLLSYRPDSRSQQPDDTTSRQPPAQQKTQPISSSSPSTSTPVFKQPPAPLADRLNPHFNAPRSEPAKTLNPDSPQGPSVANGKPRNLQMPERPATLGRTETVYMTPPSDPSEMADRFP